MDPLQAHTKYRGKLRVETKVPLETIQDMSLYYTPGVAEPCKEIARRPEAVYEYTIKGNTVAVVTDGSAVLGLGDIGPEAALPVMEGKCALFQRFANIDAWPICLDARDSDEIVSIVKALAPGFGGINLEDIAAPRCFEIEEKLHQELKIPVFHDDQHGTAIVVLAGLYNALQVVHKELSQVRSVMSGAGAAGIAIGKLLRAAGAGSILMVDSQGVVCEGREDLSGGKNIFAEGVSCTHGPQNLEEALKGADVFIGVSRGGLVTAEMVSTMAHGVIVFAMANPDPEIMPEEALRGGAVVVATGRSDFPNQLNNVLVFPGIFRGALDSRARRITTEMKLLAAHKLAALVECPTPEKIIPEVFDERVAPAVASAVVELAI